MRSALVVLLGVAAVAGVCGCANQEAALVGGAIGRSLGRPVGAVATAIDETLCFCGYHLFLIF